MVQDTFLVCINIAIKLGEFDYIYEIIIFQILGSNLLQFIILRACILDLEKRKKELHRWGGWANSEFEFRASLVTTTRLYNTFFFCLDLAAGAVYEQFQSCETLRRRLQLGHAGHRLSGWRRRQAAVWPQAGSQAEQAGWAAGCLPLLSFKLCVAFLLVGVSRQSCSLAWEATALPKLRQAIYYGCRLLLGSCKTGYNFLR